MLSRVTARGHPAILGLRGAGTVRRPPLSRERTALARECRARAQRTLIIDNYDSYTYNLYQLVADVAGVAPLVVRNDEATVADIRRWLDEGVVHNILISPGPGTPENDADVGVVPDVLRTFTDVPILGVCLGHQALALVHGAHIVRAPEPVHGRLSAVQHAGHPLFNDVPSGSSFTVVRYHSLAVDADSIPDCLECICWTAGGHVALSLAGDSAALCAAGSTQRVVMGLAHRDRPHLGVQFHPESIATAYGVQLLRNFVRFSERTRGAPPPPPLALPTPARAQIEPSDACPEPPWIEGALGGPRALGLAWRRVEHPGGLTSESLFERLCASAGDAEAGVASTSAPGDGTFWLDSSDEELGRFSFMGARGGPLWRRYTFKLPDPLSAGHRFPAASTSRPASPALGAADPQPAADRNGAGRELASQRARSSAADGRAADTLCDAGAVLASEERAQFGGRSACACGRESDGGACSCDGAGVMTETLADGSSTSWRCSLFAWLDTFTREHRIGRSVSLAASLPFDFWGGLVGFLGYEMKAECGARNAHRSRHADGAFFFADRLLALDHLDKSIYVLALHTDDAAARDAANAWIQLQTDRIASARTPVRGGSAALRPSGVLDDAAPRPGVPPHERAPSFVLAHSREQYLSNIARCQERLHAGDSYEICLTTALHRRRAPDPWRLYRVLRGINAAPYAAWLRFGQDQPTICCSSPERFLRLGRGAVLEARPIKGTAARVAGDPAADAAAAAELAASEKDRAENLMIVDLLRNDLGHVCTPGTVHVPEMMVVESFASVHQLVSTVRGVKAPERSAADCLRASFPGGSMTGAPKLRSMEIIDELEGRPRGVYSGSIGYFSVNGTFDLNIVIRSAVVHDEEVSIGAGGAIVVQSDAQEEFDEMQLKANRLLSAIHACDEPSDDLLLSASHDVACV